MSALVSVIPILLLIVLMMGFKVSGYKSAVITLVVTILLALFAAPAMGIVPEKYAEASIYGITLWSVIEGFLKACFPIILIIICAEGDRDYQDAVYPDDLRQRSVSIVADMGSWWRIGRYGRLRNCCSNTCRYTYRTGL